MTFPYDDIPCCPTFTATLGCERMARELEGAEGVELSTKVVFRSLSVSGKSDSLHGDRPWGRGNEILLTMRDVYPAAMLSFTIL